MRNLDESPFGELPEALVEEVLQEAPLLAEKLQKEFKDLSVLREEVRNRLKQESLLKSDRELPRIEVPTSCGVDGSYAIERMVVSDLVAAAAVAVEGLTPPSEERYWPTPHHRSWIQVVPHQAETGTILRALMIGMELELAANAPHKVVFLDGSLTTPLIYFNQAFSKLQETSALQVSQQLELELHRFLNSYLTLLTAPPTDRQWVAVPKYSSRREIGERLELSTQQDDKALLSFLLEAGEYTTPLPLQQPSESWHLKNLPSALQNMEKAIVTALCQVKVVYYRPFPWLPALRLEMPPAIAHNPTRLATVLTAIFHQCPSPALMEPYPLYLADRMVKHLSKALPTLRQIISQKLAQEYEGKIEQVFLALHGYRTESGV